MKTKLAFTIALVTLCQVFLAQEVKKEIVPENNGSRQDSIRPIAIEKPNSNQMVMPLIPDPNTDAAKIAEQKAKKESEKLLKEEAKAKKEMEKRQNAIARNQKRIENQQDKIQKEQKKQIKLQNNIRDAEKDINKINDKLYDTQKELLKDSETHNKKLMKGKLSPLDIEKFEKSKAKKEKRIDDLKSKIVKADLKLRKAKS